MKPKASPGTAPPAARHSEENKNTSQRDIDSPVEKPSDLPTSAQARRLPSLLVVMLVVYGLWLGWLAYVALINVRAGNQ